MSFDPSRMLYPHYACGNLPCTCQRQHKRLEVQIIKCWCPGCPRTFYTISEMQEHHMECPFNTGKEIGAIRLSEEVKSVAEGNYDPSVNGVKL